VKLRRVFLSAVCGVWVFCHFESDCGAQWQANEKRGQKPLRLLGSGWSAGYHRRNPGHDSSYYSPYSQRNTVRVSNGWYDGFEHTYRHSGQHPVPNPAQFDDQLMGLAPVGVGSSGNFQGHPPLTAPVPQPRSDLGLPAQSDAETSERENTGRPATHPGQLGRQPSKPGSRGEQMKSTNQGEWPFPID
jgi:hypothetical protein